MSDPSTPPAKWKRLLRGSLPAADRSFIDGEVDSLYRTRTRNRGRREADRWYRREAIAFALSVPAARTLGRAASRWQAITGGGMSGVGGDVRQALRSLRLNPGFTAIAILVLTLGIGANTLVFSLVDHVILRPLPYADSERLVSLWPYQSLLRGELAYIRSESATLESVAGYLRTNGFNALLRDGSARVSGHRVSPALLNVLGVPVHLGRNLAELEEQPGQDAVVMLAHAFWREQYGGRDEAIGETLVLDGRPRTIVGVLPAGFAFPDPQQQVLVPLVMDPGDPGVFWGAGGNQAVARMRPGIAPATVQSELRELAEQTRLQNPLWTPTEDFRANTRVLPLQDSMVSGVRSNLFVLLAAVGLVMLVACANVANLMLARGLARGHDLAVRAALGADRRRLIRAQLIESLVLVGLGCAVAFVVAYEALGPMVGLLPAEIPRATEIRLDPRVLGAGILVALATGLTAGLVPSLRAARVDPGNALRSGGRGGGADRTRRRLSRLMVVAQLATAVVLITGAGLLIRSLDALVRVDVGFEPRGLTKARLTLSGDAYAEDEARLAFFHRVEEQAGHLPGVRFAAVTSQVPFDEGWMGIATFIDGVTEDPNGLPVVTRRVVSPPFFETLGLRLVRGRAFDSRDRDDSPLVAVIDQTMVDRFWPDEDPVGRRIRYPWRGAPWIEIVGVVSGAADGDPGDEYPPTYYVPLGQQIPGAMTLIVRADTAARTVAPGLREIVAGTDDQVPVSRVASMPQVLSASLERARWSTLLVAGFAAIALALGCVGIYGIVAYSVGTQQREFGVRMALGAEASRVRAVVLGSGIALAAPGAVIGMLVAMPASRALEGMLYGVDPLDPITLLAVPVLLTAAAALAAYFPARRATRIDPAVALRGDA